MLPIVRCAAAAALLLTAFPPSQALAADSPAAVRSHGDRSAGARAAGRFDPGLLQYREVDRVRQPAGAGSGPSRAKSHCCDFWVHDADVTLFDDFDHDGHFSFLRVVFDVDTHYVAADVYADVYLVDHVGDFTHLHRTRVFGIHGTSGSDDFEVEAELVSGFPTDDYDLLIEVFDADTDEFVADFGPADSSAMSRLPLEDVNRDSHADPVVHAHGHGGGLPLAALLVLGLGVTARMRARRAP